ncbi:MAG TPA: acyl carrier protein [Mycobacteriales bacterium]|jgi:acyl carrier protein|nr:acyl carrier protein [Mycobacteriales bacterium]
MSRTEEVRTAVAEHLGIEPALLRDQASLSQDLGLDSLAGIELATALEDRFALRITDDELAGLRTYGELERLVLRKVAA